MFRNNNNRETSSVLTTSMMTQSQQELLEKLQTNIDTGLTTDQASQRREQDGTFNVVRPPVDCPSWLCILLPCIRHIPSMKAFSTIRPDDAEVLRNSKWIRYDSSSLVKGDIVRIEEGDFVPGDCAVLNVSSEEDLLVDLRNITGDERLKTVGSTTSSSSEKMTTLYYGGLVVQGSALVVITAIGPNTLLAKLIREKRFPPTEPVLEAEDDNNLSIV